MNVLVMCMCSILYMVRRLEIYRFGGLAIPNLPSYFDWLITRNIGNIRCLENLNSFSCLAMNDVVCYKNYMQDMTMMNAQTFPSIWTECFRSLNCRRLLYPALIKMREICNYNSLLFNCFNLIFRGISYTILIDVNCSKSTNLSSEFTWTVL